MSLDGLQMLGSMILIFRLATLFMSDVDWLLPIDMFLKRV